MESSIQSKILRRYIKWLSVRTNRGAPVEEQRQTLENSVKFLRMPGKVSVEPTRINGLYAEWLTAPHAQMNRVILYLHGGGYVLGSPNTHRAMVARIAQASQTRALLLDYRLAPEHPFPAAILDTVNTYCWLIQQGYTPENIIFMGDSAGGGLALASILWLRDEGQPLPGAVVLLSPLTDLTASGESVRTRKDIDPMNKPEDIVLIDHYIGDNSILNPLLSPLFADMHNIPPLFIQVGDHEIMRSDATRLAAKARRARVKADLHIWHEMWHVWQIFAPFLPEANQAIEQIGQYVQGLAQKEQYAA